MTELERWLGEATRHLSAESAAQVRMEIVAHYESTRDYALAEGAAVRDAEWAAVRALGDPRTANAEYRRALLTTVEARLLRDGNREARAVCARPWLKWAALGIPIVVAAAATLCLRAGQAALARDLLVVALGMSPLFAALFLRIDTPSRGRAFRWVKCTAMTIALAWVFGGQGLRLSWLLFACLWPLVWTEWTRASIRRKLPVAKWPRQLYL